MASTTAAAAPAKRMERANQMYREGRYEEALALYSESLGTAKSRSHKIALHTNLAACFLKLQLFNKAAEECTSVLEIDHNHTGALMMRAQTLVMLKEYHSALFDMNRLIELHPSSEVYQNLQSRLKKKLSLATIPEAEAELEEEDEGKELPEPEIVEEKVHGEEHVDSEVGRDQDNEFSRTNPNAEVYPPQTQELQGIIQTEFKRMTSNPKT